MCPIEGDWKLIITEIEVDRNQTSTKGILSQLCAVDQFTPARRQFIIGFV